MSSSEVIIEVDARGRRLIMIRLERSMWLYKLGFLDISKGELRPALCTFVLVRIYQCLRLSCHTVSGAESQGWQGVKCSILLRVVWRNRRSSLGIWKPL